MKRGTATVSARELLAALETSSEAISSKLTY